MKESLQQNVFFSEMLEEKVRDRERKLMELNLTRDLGEIEWSVWRIEPSFSECFNSNPEMQIFCQEHVKYSKGHCHEESVMYV
jgi:hypothetical protein